MVRVELHNDNQGGEWDAYVEDHPDGTLFHTLRWMRAVGDTFGHQPQYLLAKKAGGIVGVLPLFVVQTLKGRALVSVPYAVYGGILADSPDIQQTLLDAVRRLGEKHRAKYVEMRNQKPNDLGLPGTNLYVHFEKALPEKPEDCLASIPRKSRAAVRNGRRKFKVTSLFTSDLDKLHHMYAVNVRRLGSPTIPFAFLLKLREEFGDRMDVLHTMFEGSVVCCVLNFYFKDTVVPYYSGSDNNYFFTQCNNVMYCDLMEEGVRRGYKFFDFGRSRADTGPFTFKENMGFQPSTLGYQYLLLGISEIPKINPSNPRFQLPRKIWSCLPLGLTKIVGPQLLKFIP